MTFAQHLNRTVDDVRILVELDLNGVTRGYSFNEFTPVGSTIPYQGRIKSIFSLTKDRDPMFFGKMAYQGGTISLINGDGEFDQYAADAGFVPLVFDGSWVYDGSQTWDGVKIPGIYGGVIRVKFGYADIDISTYATIYTGYIDSLSIDEETFSITVRDKRKKLDTEIQHSWINTNALTVIKEAIILADPSISYTGTYFDTTAWAAASALAPLVSVDMIDPKSANDVIEMVCLSCFGELVVTGAGLFSFKFINPDATASTTIVNTDVLNKYNITYDPSDVISSAIVYCDIDYNLNTGNYATKVTDTTREGLVYARYGVYKEQKFYTYLPNATAASVFSSTILDYFQDVHGTFDITAPMRYYTLEVGDVVNVEINRISSTMVGTKKCEVLGKTYDLENSLISLHLRMCYD